MPFPLRAAALDVGSNAIRYHVVEFSDATTYLELENQRLPVRLGHHAFTTGYLQKDALDAAVAAAVQFRKRIDACGVAHYRAVATSAVRESRNGGELVDRVRRESGIRLETITGTEEARLVWLAARHRFPFDQGKWLFADLGGGSVEISLVDREGIQWTESHPMGTVRLVEDLGGEQAEPGTFRALVEQYVARLSLPEPAVSGVEGLLITGGNADALAGLVEQREESGGVAEISRSDLANLADRLAGMSVQERMDRLDLRADRADVILPAAILFGHIADLAGADRIVAPGVGVKEGLLLDLAADALEHRAHSTALDRTTLEGAIAVGRRYQFDEPHARQVADLALSLYDQLQGLHELDEISKRRLIAAALLHDVGQFVAYRRHHKHSWYLIRHSELPGLSPKDIRIVALIARYHRRSEPKGYHEEYAKLRAEERAEVRKLAAILRIADALDREHRGRVANVRTVMEPDRIALQIESRGPTLLEQWALRKKAGLFEKVYGTELTLA